MAKTYWGALTDEGAEWLAQSGLSAAGFKIFFFIVSSTGDDNQVKNARHNLFSELHKTTGISKATFYKGFQSLIDAKALYYYKNGYMVNPNIYYKGGKKNGSLLERAFLQDVLGFDAELLEDLPRLHEKITGPLVDELVKNIFSSF